MKGYKVSDAKLTRIIGVACKNLNELKAKGKMKLGIEAEVRVQLKDGTFVDDDQYFQTLPPQTVFLLLKPGETGITSSAILFNALEAVNMDFLRAGKKAQAFFAENVKEKIIRLAKLLREPLQTKSVVSSKKSDDPDWFKGIDSISVTKEEFMARRSQDRIRGYLYKTKDEVKKSQDYQTEPELRKQFTNAFGEMTLQLKHDHYFGGYFDRKSQSVRLCDDSGDFFCNGRWNVDRCQYNDSIHGRHIINPYASREARIVFSTWNFDHVVERSRTIIPAIMEAAKLAAENKCSINSDYFYKLLFTTANLKLVHVVCHDKGSHSVQCNKLEYIK
ncbi:DNA fragmentation factor subunit beta [Blattella germanica]|nr:DNA fragmentation factor subunit beta [Blattella germanica]